MARKAFDRHMVDGELGSNPKIGRLTDAQFRCLVTGVWALAAKASPRGYLVVAGETATPQDVAHQARCSPTVARGTLDALRKLGMLEVDAVSGLEFCHDWWDMNPDPRADVTAAERKRRQRERERDEAAGHADVTRDVTHDVTACHTDEGEGEVKERANALSRPAASGPDAKQREREKASDDDRRLCRLLAEQVRARNPKAPISSDVAWLTPMRLCREQDKNTPAEIERLIRWVFTDPCDDAQFWAGTIQSASGLRNNFAQAWGKMITPAAGLNGRRVQAVESTAEYLARRGAA